jgi:hypothetical protein
VHVGLSVIALGWFGWRHRARVPVKHAGFWLLVIVFFGVMALGPNLKVFGHELAIGDGITMMGHEHVNPIVMPYAVLWLLFPPWRLAGVPLRMMVMVQLAVALLAAAGWQALDPRRRTLLAAVTLIAITVEYLPTRSGCRAPRCRRTCARCRRCRTAPCSIWLRTARKPFTTRRRITNRSPSDTSPERRRRSMHWISSWRG